jgi:putative transposase
VSRSGSFTSMFYNSYRLHSYLDYRSSNQCEMEMAELRKVA